MAGSCAIRAPKGWGATMHGTNARGALPRQLARDPAQGSPKANTCLHEHSLVPMSCTANTCACWPGTKLESHIIYENPYAIHTNNIIFFIVQSCTHSRITGMQWYSEHNNKVLATNIVLSYVVNKITWKYNVHTDTPIIMVLSLSFTQWKN